MSRTVLLLIASFLIVMAGLATSAPPPPAHPTAEAAKGSNGAGTGGAQAIAIHPQAH